MPRTDALEKVTGQAAYAYDMRLPGMLYGEILRSPLPHARVVKIDTSAAEAMPGVLAVYTQKDMPQNKFGAFVQDETALADGVVRYQGEGVAAVIAIDEQTALDGLRAIDVDYEPLPGVFDPEAAMEEGAPELHEGAERNVVAHNRVAAGDIDAAFADADHVFEDRFVTSRQCHTCMEPHSVDRRLRRLGACDAAHVEPVDVLRPLRARWGSSACRPTRSGSSRRISAAASARSPSRTRSTSSRSRRR